MALVWLVVEVGIGVVLAGAVSSVVVAAGARWGAPPGPWVAWGTVAVCIALTVAIGERLRRRTRT